MFDAIPPQFLYMLPAFLIVLTVIVFVHEMGHYLVARWNGIAIQTFSIGFGPELIGFTDRHGTRWRISAIPLGGYVRFVGDMNAGEHARSATSSSAPIRSSPSACSSTRIPGSASPWSSPGRRPM